MWILCIPSIDKYFPVVECFKYFSYGFTNFDCYPNPSQLKEHPNSKVREVAVHLAGEKNKTTSLYF